MGKTKESLIKLMNRDITPRQCKRYLPPCNEDELEKLILLSKIPIRVRKKLSIKDAKTMNFMEVREYCREKEKEGLNINDLSIELDVMWENGEISGFDYRYFKESIGLEVSRTFITQAKSIGRFGK